LPAFHSPRDFRMGGYGATGPFAGSFPERGKLCSRREGGRRFDTAHLIPACPPTAHEFAGGRGYTVARRRVAFLSIAHIPRARRPGSREFWNHDRAIRRSH